MKRKQLVVLFTGAIIASMMASCMIALTNPMPSQKGPQLVAR